MKFTNLTTMAMVLVIVLSTAEADAGPFKRKKKSLDKSKAVATSDAPVQAKVEVLSLPFEPELPIFVITVEPFTYSASGQVSGGGQGAPVGGSGIQSGKMVSKVNPDGSVTSTWSTGNDSNIGAGISAQLVTALMNWGNISVLEFDSLVKEDNGTYSCNLQDGEIGPIIIRGIVTEFNETADLDTKKKGGSLRKVGLFGGIAGAITGNRALTYTGAGVAAADPTWGGEETNRTGIVGLDIRLVNGNTGRLVGGFNATGSFTTLSKVNGKSLFGIGGSQTQFAASSIGQATRAAMNSTLEQIAEACRRLAIRQRPVTK